LWSSGSPSSDYTTYSILSGRRIGDRGAGCGKFFIEPSEPIYAGQVIGEHSRSGDLVINVTKTKKLTNMRASGSDEKMRISPAVKFSLEEALEYIQADEYVEVTPKSIRLRKIYLDENDRKRDRNKAVGANA